MVAVPFTALYMFRLYFMTFSGDYGAAHVEGHPESEPEHAGHNVIPGMRHLVEGDEHSDNAHGHTLHAPAPHESPPSNTAALGVRAVPRRVVWFRLSPGM